MGIRAVAKEAFVILAHKEVLLWHRKKRARKKPEEKEQRNADERAAAEADQLSLRQVESDLRFYFCQVLGDRNIGHKITLSIG